MFYREKQLVDDLDDKIETIVSRIAFPNDGEVRAKFKAEWLKLIKAYRHEVISDYYQANLKPGVRDNEISMDTFLLMQSNLCNKFMPADALFQCNKILEINKVEIHKNVSKPIIK